VHLLYLYGLSAYDDGVPCWAARAVRVFLPVLEHCFGLFYSMRDTVLCTGTHGPPAGRQPLDFFRRSMGARRI
jgi:hypothetical protein